MSKIRTLGVPFVCASLVAAGAIVVAWPSPNAPEREKASSDQTVQAFMALGPSSKTSDRAAKSAKPAPTTGCVPCDQRAAESIAGHVASKRPSQLVDREYERITGRERQAVLPSESGTAPVSSDRSQRGWLMIITGLPIRQTNAYVEIDSDRLRLSQLSGALHLESTPYSLTTSPQEPDARLLVESIAQFRRISEHDAATWAREQKVGGMTIVSVSTREICAVPTGVTWRPDAPQDVRVRLSQSGRITHMEYVRAQGDASTVAASRVVWFPEYDPP